MRKNLLRPIANSGGSVAHCIDLDTYNEINVELRVPSYVPCCVLCQVIVYHRFLIVEKCHLCFPETVIPVGYWISDTPGRKRSLLNCAAKRRHL